MATIFLPDGSRVQFDNWARFTRTEHGGTRLVDSSNEWKGDILPNGTIFLNTNHGFKHHPPLAPGDINTALSFVIEHLKSSEASGYKLADLKKLLQEFDAKRKEWK